MQTCNFKKQLSTKDMINITFPDGSVRQYESGVSAFDIANSISPRLAADVLAATVITAADTTGKGQVYDVTRPINEDAAIRLHKWEDPEAKHVFWHSSSHLLAAALEALYPGVKFGIGPAIETGFYYDVDFGDKTLVEADLKAIEDKMIELARQKNPFVRTEVSKEDALKTFTEKGDEYKCELISELEDGTITFYTNGDFTDLCRGPHLKDTSVIKAVKLTAIAGAYWRGNQERQMLTRVYGVTFPKKSLLDEYLQMMEEAKKRDHRKIGKEMELFSLVVKSFAYYRCRYNIPVAIATALVFVPAITHLCLRRFPAAVPDFPEGKAFLENLCFHYRCHCRHPHAGSCRGTLI